MPELTQEQKTVFDAAERFIRDPRPAKQWFTFHGAAGTGKSFLLAALAKAYPETIQCAFTGKAASVLSRRTGMPSVTIHSFIYNCLGEDEETGKPRFRRKHKDGDLDAMVALVDECSVVDEWLARDLLATGCKVVTCGDLNQLRPVKGRAFFADPDARLVTVHRQARDSAIIRQAHTIRHSGVYGDDGVDFRVVRGFSAAEALAADVVLCYRNNTRHELNRLIRGWKGLPWGVAVKGEPVMCLKNNHDLKILNGAVYPLLADHVQGSKVIEIANEVGEPVEIENAWIETFENMPIAAEVQPFAFGYACTVHKSQGSQWDRVILIDEHNRSDERCEWLYTGVTRAAKSIIVQRNW